MSATEVVREGLDALMEAVPRLAMERRLLEQRLEAADQRLDEVRSECAAVIESFTELQLKRFEEDRESRDLQMRQLERDRILSLIRFQLEQLNQRGISARALKALQKMILEDVTVSDLERRVGNVQPRLLPCPA